MTSGFTRRLRNTSSALRSSQRPWRIDMSWDNIYYCKIEGKRGVEIFEKSKGFFEEDSRIELAYIFGSFTRRSEIRDMDIAVYATPALTFDSLLDLNARIELILRIPVDLVQLQDVSPLLKQKILMHGVHLVMKNKVMHHVLLSQAFSEFQDFMIQTKRKTTFRRGDKVL
jgi:predicted nucleotidyltransferase